MGVLIVINRQSRLKCVMIEVSKCYVHDGFEVHEFTYMSIP